MLGTCAGWIGSNVLVKCWKPVLVGLVLMFLLGVGLVLMFLLSVGLVLMFLLSVRSVLMFLLSVGNLFSLGWF